MLYVSKKQAESYYGDGYLGMDYPIKDSDINFAVIKIEGNRVSSKYGL